MKFIVLTAKHWKEEPAMKCDKNAMLLYAVTDRTWLEEQSLYQQVESALKGGATCIQLREKSLDEAAFLVEALELKTLCGHYQVPLIINDNVSVTMKCQADGIHVGQKDLAVSEVRSLIGSDMILGVSAQNVEQALSAEKNGADYLGVGAVFSASTKLDATTVSVQTLQDICSAVSIPVVAIGRIGKDNILNLAGTKVDGVALVSAIFASSDIESECRELLALSTRMVSP